jgi:predicted RNase H-like nuclease
LKRLAAINGTQQRVNDAGCDVWDCCALPSVGEGGQPADWDRSLAVERGGWRYRNPVAHAGDYVTGIDGCAGGWVAVTIPASPVGDAGTPAAARIMVAPTLVGLALTGVVGIDMPLGLLTDGWREADALARRALGRRGVTVFAIPPRPVWEQPTYADANRTCRELTGKGMSAQTWGLRAKLLEADAYRRHYAPTRPAPTRPAPTWPATTRTDADSQRRQPPTRPAQSPPAPTRPAPTPPDADPQRRECAPARPAPTDACPQRRQPPPRLYEVHPELAFAALAGAPIPESKHTSAGLAIRRELLTQAGLALPARVPGAAENDLLDAAAVAWSARRIAVGQAVTVTNPAQRADDGAEIAIRF